MLRFIPRVDAGRPLSVLCLGAHSDDLEIGCAGALLRLLAEHPGAQVHWVVLSASDEREREARASAADILRSAGQSTVLVERFRESYFPYTATDVKDYFEGLKRQVTPDLIFTHRREDEHQDHRVVSELTWNTFRNHALLEYEIPKYEGDLGRPNLFVPLSTSQAERKLTVLQTHFASQAGRRWFRRETFAGLLSVRGVECNAPEGFAEAFYARKMVL